jgi:hypothetical protein
MDLPQITIPVAEDLKHDSRWNLCCSSVYKAEVIYITQIIFLFTILIFSIIQITLKTPNIEIYFSLISTIIGLIIPSPKMTKND